jgi:hypothetical protein
MRLDEQEPADLRDMRSRRDVDEIILLLRVEGIGVGEVAHGAIDLLKVPRVGQVQNSPFDFGLWRDLRDVASDALRERGCVIVVNELQPVDQKILVLTERHGRAPSLPVIVLAGVHRRAEKADDHSRPRHLFIQNDKIRYL